MIKKLSLIGIVALSGTLTFCEEKAQPTAKEQAIAQLTTGPVSAKTEKIVRELLEKFGIDTTDPEIIIAQPSALAKELNPLIEFPISLIPPYKLYLINEANFNKLSRPEKEVMIAYKALQYVLESNSWKIPGTALSIPKEIAGNSTLWLFLLLPLEVLLGIAIYRILGEKTKLTQIKRIIIAVFIVLIPVLNHQMCKIEQHSELVLVNIHHNELVGVWQRKSINPMAKTYELDKKIVEMIGSPDGYITYLKRLQKDVQEFKKSANFNFWQNIEASLAPRIKYLESLRSRLSDTSS